MLNKISPIIFFCICISVAGCNRASKEPALQFETISDSVYKPDDNYKQSLVIWKDYYEKCMNQQLFADAFYLQLQNKLNIGSINNAQEINVNEGTPIIDTSGNNNIFTLLAIISSANCSENLPLNNNLRMNFYGEVVKLLSASPDFKNMVAALDSGQMTIKVGTVYNYTLRPDSLISMLNRTTDSSLIRYKELLLKPENVMLAQTVDILGFTAEFPLKTALAASQQTQLAKEWFFTIDVAANANGSMILLPNNNLRLKINKRYSVLGKFLQLKAG